MWLRCQDLTTSATATSGQGMRAKQLSIDSNQCHIKATCSHCQRQRNVQMCDIVQAVENSFLLAQTLQEKAHDKRRCGHSRCRTLGGSGLTKAEKSLPVANRLRLYCPRQTSARAHSQVRSVSAKVLRRKAHKLAWLVRTVSAVSKLCI